MFLEILTNTSNGDTPQSSALLQPQVPVDPMLNTASFHQIPVPPFLDDCERHCRDRVPAAPWMGFSNQSSSFKGVIKGEVGVMRDLAGRVENYVLRGFDVWEPLGQRRRVLTCTLM